MSDQNNGQGHKDVTIIVNGREKIAKKEKLSFEEIVVLAFDNPPTGDNVMFTILYRKGEGNKDGTLLPGEFINIKNGMIFNVSATDKS